MIGWFQRKLTRLVKEAIVDLVEWAATCDVFDPPPFAPMTRPYPLRHGMPLRTSWPIRSSPFDPDPDGFHPDPGAFPGQSLTDYDGAMFGPMFDGLPPDSSLLDEDLGRELFRRPINFPNYGRNGGERMSLYPDPIDPRVRHVRGGEPIIIDPRAATPSRVLSPDEIEAEIDAVKGSGSNGSLS